MRPLIAFLFLSQFSNAADVLIYGATPGGIAAAISSAKSGSSVLLVEPTSEIGGLVTSGLSHTDFHSFESLSGSFADFASRVEKHYIKTYGADSQQVKDCFRGTFAEPKVNLLIFREMLAEHPNISVSKNTSLTGVTVENRRIVSATFGAETHEAKVFIDASYEGDLMAKAGVKYHVGREGRAEFDESLAPETADSQLQAYNFRLIMTPEASNRVPAPKPPGYTREDYVEVLPSLGNEIKKLFDYPKQCIFKAQTPPLPNNKYDINDVSGGYIRLSLPGKNLGWPDGDEATRKAIFAEHIRDQVGLVYFLQNDEAVPENFRAEANEWGFAKDEFTGNNHLPPQLYVREARRMRGEYVYSQKDSIRPADDARAKFFADSITMGDYGNNCHGTFHEGPRFGGKHTGEFYNPVPPYQVPYGVLLPKTIDNLLVPVAVSSTHVGFCALRLEPIWMSLGQAAGFAATFAVKQNEPLSKITVAAIQDKLIEDKSALIYFSDLPLDSPDFARVQKWALTGAYHGVEAWPKTMRGKKIHGQYNHAAPGHAAKLDEPLSPGLKKRWLGLAGKHRLPVEKANAANTRGEFIRALFP